MLWCCLWDKVQAPKRGLDADFIFWHSFTHIRSQIQMWMCSFQAVYLCSCSPFPVIVTSTYASSLIFHWKKSIKKKTFLLCFFSLLLLLLLLLFSLSFSLSPPSLSLFPHKYFLVSLQLLFNNCKSYSLSLLSSIIPLPFPTLCSPSILLNISSWFSLMITLLPP